MAFVVLLLFGALSAQACETCGCSAAGGDPGALPGWGGNYLALSFRMDHFDNGWQAPLDGPSEALFRSHDHLYNWTLTGAWQPVDRIHVLAGLPYRWNHRMQGNTALDRSGIGDAWVLLRYALWVQDQPDALASADAVASGPMAMAQRSFVSIGAGMEMPSGRFEPESADALLPVNNQLGSGSWDFSAEFRSRFAFGEGHSLNLDATGRRNGSNRHAYRFGQLANVHMHWRWSRVLIPGAQKAKRTGLQATQVPARSTRRGSASRGSTPRGPNVRGRRPWHCGFGLGLAGDWLGLDANDGFLRTDTGGKALHAQASARLGRGQASLSMRYRHPLLQDYANGQTHLNSSMDFALAWRFAD